MAVQTQGFEDIESVDDLNDVDNANKADGRVLVYRSASGNMEYETPAAGGGSPSVFFAQAADGANLGTAFGVIDWAPIITDSGYSESAGVITIGAALDGVRARVDWSVSCTGATNRVELRTELRVDGSPVATAANYSARNSTQNTGGVSGFHFLTLADGMEIDVRALRDGSTANKIQDGTALSIVTL